MANIMGTAGNDTLTDTSGDDTIASQGGNDTIIVTSGRDTVDGGTGLDLLTVSYAALTVAIMNNGESQFNEASGLGATSVTFSNIERFNVSTGSGDDTIRTFVRNSFSNSIVTSGNDLINGGAGNDRLAGGGGNDFIRGGAGDDILDGEGALRGLFGGTDQTLTFTGNDRLLGDAGNDTLYGGSGDDTLEGGADNDVLNGDAYAFIATDGSIAGGPNVAITPTDVDPNLGTNVDTLNGGTGDDILVTRFGADVLDGGAGIDVLVYDRRENTTGLTVDVSTGAGVTADGVSFTSVERLQAVGGSGADTFTGGALADTFIGGAGDDTFLGGLGNDTISGGLGNDTAIFNSSNDGSDTVNLGAGADTVNVGGAAGQIRLSFTSSEIGNNNANDAGTMLNQDGGLAVRFQREDGSDVLTGPISRFDDEGTTFVAGAGITFDVRDLVSGAQRGDLFRTVSLGTNLGDTFLGTAEADYVNAGMGDDTVSGGLGNDFLVGGAGDDTLNGEDGDDTFLGGLGNDTITGGSGNDIAIFNSSNDGSDTVNLGAGADTVNVGGAAGQIRLSFTSAEVGNNSANDAGTMLNQDGGLAVRFQREDGSDVLTGPISRFDDEGTTFVAGAGITFDVRDLVSGAQRGNLFRTVSLGTNLGDTFLGTAEADYVNAGMGDDTVSGGLGNDFLVGGAGIDTLNGEDGDDTFIGGGGGDIISGGVGNDTANGGDGGDRIDGGVGDDSLRGDAGDDFLMGGLGNDALTGGDGLDTADFSGAAGVVNVNLNSTGAQNTGSGSDTLASIENVIGAGGNDKLTGNALTNVLDGGAGNDVISGQAGADTLKGGLGNDSLFGGDGDDFLIGGEGTDTMQGNLGADSFVLTSLADSMVGAGRDLISDFEQGSDLIDLRLIDAITGGSDNAFAFVGTAAFSNVAGELRFFAQNATTMVVEGDVNGDGVADFQISVRTSATLQSSDFLL